MSFALLAFSATYAKKNKKKLVWCRNKAKSGTNPDLKTTMTLFRSAATLVVGQVE